MKIKSKCPHCDQEMEYTGLPDIAGDIDFRFFKCAEHGLIKVKAKEWKEQNFKELNNEDSS